MHYSCEDEIAKFVPRDNRLAPNGVIECKKSVTLKLLDNKRKIHFLS